MIVRLWGTRGSLAAPGVETARYGGNTSCVEVRGNDGGVIVLDAGTGVRRLGAKLPTDLQRIDVLLTHLHMDHVQGLGFFEPLYRPGLEIHMWGPASPMAGLRARLMRYLSPPLFRDCGAVLAEGGREPGRLGEGLRLTGQFGHSLSVLGQDGMSDRVPVRGVRVDGPEHVPYCRGGVKH